MQFPLNFTLLRGVTIVAAIFAGSSAGAAEASFVSPVRMQAMLILAAPASASSAVAARELAELHALEATRTPEQVARAMADDKDESIFLFREVIGAHFNAQARKR